MILQGVGHPVPYLGVWYANDPKKGGYMAYAPALDLTTLFEVISENWSNTGVLCTALVAGWVGGWLPPPPPRVGVGQFWVPWVFPTSG